MALEPNMNPCCLLVEPEEGSMLYADVPTPHETKKKQVHVDGLLARCGQVNSGVRRHWHKPVRKIALGATQSDGKVKEPLPK
jgi:hypothetical protein